MSRRSKLIYLLSLDAMLASVLVALVTVLLTAGAGRGGFAAGCDAAQPGPGDFVPTIQGVRSVEEAEAVICHDLAYPRETAAWRLEQVTVWRPGPAASAGHGQGFVSATLDYALPGSGEADLRIEVSPFRIAPVAYGIVDVVEIMGAEANLIQGSDPTLAIVQWEADGFSFYVEARLADGFDLPALYTILDSIR